MNMANKMLPNQVAQALIERDWTIALAESCTGGLVCATLTELSGSSAWFERGYITYSNQAKAECLNVPAEMIDSFGAVSEQVAKAMALGAQQNAGVNVAIAITGIAGPTGGSPTKPVGTVCFSWAIRAELFNGVTNSVNTKTIHFEGDRQAIRQQACDFALSELLLLLKNS